MAASLAFVTLFVAEGWILPVFLAVILIAISIYILSRPRPQAAAR